MDDRLKFKLSDIENEAIFHNKILPEILRTSALEPNARPTMMVVGGQPGAGKSESIKAIGREFAQHGGVIQANVDDLREFHPQYEALTQANDRTASNYTHADAKQWAQRIEDYARANRYNVLVESLMTSPDGVGPWLEDYRRAGYATEVRIVAVNERASLQGIVGRYEAQKAHSGEANVGRTVPREVHDMAYSRVLDTVENIETEKLADRVVVHVRDGRIIYENALQPDGQWQHPPAARQAIIAERGRSLMPAEWNEHIKRFDDISANQHRPGRHASVDEIDEVRQLRRSAVREGGLTAQVGMHPHLSRAMGAAGIATTAYDAANSLHRGFQFQEQQNPRAAQAEALRFAASNLGGWGGAIAGASAGAALGVESGPGLLLTGAMGGIAGAMAGDNIAGWITERQINHQQDRDGHTWTFDPQRPEQGWTRNVMSLDNIGSATVVHPDANIPIGRPQPIRADATLSDELSFKAACAMVELAVASPPPIQYPYTLPAEARDRNPEHLHEAPYWERNPNTGAWTRQVGTGQAGNDRHMQFETEPASAERAEELDHQARAMLDANTKKMPATMAVEFQREYAHRGWSQYGPVPTAVQNALEHPGRIAGQDNKLYERNAEGQWIHNRLLLRNQQAGGSLHEALEVTYQTQQRAMQPVTMAEPVTVRPTLEEWREAGLSDADFPYDMPLPDAPEHQIERASLSQREAYAQSLSEANRQGLDRQAAEQMASARTIPQGLSEVALEKATPAMKPPQRAESIIAGAAPITAVAMQAARHAAILERQTATIIPSPAETVREETSPSVSVTVTATDDMEEQEPRLRNHDFEQHRMDAPDLGKQRLPPDNSERMDAERAARAFQSPQEGPVGRTDHRDTGNVVNGPAHTPATMEKDASEFRFERQRDPAPPPIPDEVPVQHRSVDLQHENGDHDPGLRVSGSPIDGMKEQAGLGGDRETKDTRDGFDTSSDMDSRIVQENAPLSAMTFGRPMADSGKKDKIEENPVPRVSESVAQPSPSPRFEPPIPDEPEAEVTERELARRDHYQIPEDYKPTGHVQFDMLYEAIAFGNEADVDRVRVALRDCEAGDRSVAEVAARVDAIKEATMKQEMEQTQQQVELHGMDMAAQHGPVMVMTLRRPGGAPEGDSGSDGDGGGGGGG